MWQRLQKLVAGTFGDRGRTAGTVMRPSDIFGNVPTSQLSQFKEYLAAGTGKLWASYHACNIVAKAVLDTKWSLRRGDGTEPVEIKGLSQLLQVPNGYDAFSEMLYKTVFHIKLTGNCFWLKDTVNETGDRPERIYILNPSKVEIVVDPRNGVIGYIYRSDKIQIPLDRGEVIHFRNPHPNREYYGIGEIEAAALMMQNSINRQDAQTSFWKNGAAPSGLLFFKNVHLDQSQFEEAKRQFNRQYGGKDNIGKLAMLMGDWDFKQIGLTAAEGQDLEQGKQSVNDIFTIHGVPLSVAGVQGAANYATAQIDDLRFRRDTVKPMIKLIADTMNSDLVAGFDPRARIEWDIQGLVDLAQLAQLTPLFDRGALSINELRGLAGLAPVQDNPVFDSHYITAGLLPLELAGITNDANADEQSQRTISRFIDRTLNPPSNA